MSGFCLVVSGGAPSRRSDAPEIPQALGVGQAGAAAAREQVLALVLYNTGNSCYQKAFVLSWLWTLVHANALQAGGYSDAGLGRGRGVVDALLGGAVDKWRPQLQHDVGAFASHALAKLRGALMCGEWQSRRGDPALRVLDNGLLHIPITMEIRDLHRGLETSAFHSRHVLSSGHVGFGARTLSPKCTTTHSQVSMYPDAPHTCSDALLHGCERAGHLQCFVQGHGWSVSLGHHNVLRLLSGLLE